MTDLLMANISPKDLNHNFNRFFKLEFSKCEKLIFCRFWDLSLTMKICKTWQKYLWSPELAKTTPYTSCRSHKIEVS